MNHAKLIEKEDLRAAYRWRREGSSRKENRWPGGPRVLVCLMCEVRFMSTQRDMRCCPPCRGDGPGPRGWDE
jgi:hypothetical protein